MVIRFLWRSRDLNTPGASATEMALAFPCVAALVTQEGPGEDCPTLIYVPTGHISMVVQAVLVCSTL